MARITNRMITDKFIAAFENGKPFTPSQLRLMGIQTAQLKKNIKKYLESLDEPVDLSVEEIIMDNIEYSSMIGMKFRSIASLGYESLPKSIEYWKKRRLIEASNKENKKNDENLTNKVEKLELESYSVNKKENNPKWMHNDEW